MPSVFGLYLSYNELRRHEALPHGYFQLADVSNRIIGTVRAIRAIIYDDACHLAAYAQKQLPSGIYSRVLVDAKYAIGRFRALNRTCDKTSPAFGPFSWENASILAGIDAQRDGKLPRPLKRHIDRFSLRNPGLFNIALILYMDMRRKSVASK